MYTKLRTDSNIGQGTINDIQQQYRNCIAGKCDGKDIRRKKPKLESKNAYMLT